MSDLPMYALLNDYGVPCEETALCSICYQDEDYRRYASEQGMSSDDIQDFITFSRSGSIDTFTCRICGKKDENWRPFGCVSSGTLREKTLISRYEAALNRLKIKYERPISDQQDMVSKYHVQLFDLLAEAAPEGYYFGVHPRCDTSFGFWKNRSDSNLQV